MAASGAPERRPRRGPAPIASFDHDVSDESSPETKQTFRLPEIREVPACGTPSGSALVPPEHRARSHSSPAVHANAAGGLHTPAAPRIDISRASSSSHHDSRDSSPELALFSVGGEEGRTRLELGFREDGALELRSSTEELAFLEGAPGEARVPSAAPASRRHSRKDSQSSEAALLAVSGRTSRLSSVGSQCSAHSALSAFSHTSRVSRLSVVSGASRSPSPHKMLLETSFCGPKPIETDPEICAAAVEERLLKIAKYTSEPVTSLDSPSSSAPTPICVPVEVSVAVTPPIDSTPASTTLVGSVQEVIPEPVDARDHREVRTEVTVESTRAAHSPRPTSPTATPSAVPPSPTSCSNILDEDKRQKETRNRARVEERRARSRERRAPAQPEVYKSTNRSKDIIRIKLKPDHEYDDDDDDESERTLVGGEPARKPDTLELQARGAAGGGAAGGGAAGSGAAEGSPAARRARSSRTPSPLGAPVSRKSSFCSLFKSRETIASPDSPCDVLRRKKSLNEGRSRSKSRDRSTTPTSASKIKGSVLSLFKTPRKSATSPSPGSRDGSPVIQPLRQFPQQQHRAEQPTRGERLKYYEDAKDGIIHIPLRTPSDEVTSGTATRERSPPRDAPRPASAPQARAPPERPASVSSVDVTGKPTKRTVLPDGSIIIPLHSPTEKAADNVSPPNASLTPASHRSIPSSEKVTPPSGSASVEKFDAAEGAATTPERPCEADRGSDDEHRKRRERIVFTTHVGSRDQVFSTQFSITKTPSVTSEMSESLPSFMESEEARGALRETHVAASPDERPHAPEPCAAPERDSSGSEAEEAARAGSEVERRGLVVQESFEEELPYVPTTLPLERSLAVPMVPVRERSGVRVAGVQRPRAPRATEHAPPRAPPAAAVDAAPPVKLRIRLPRRTRTASASAPPRAARPRTRSGGDEILAATEMRKKSEWIDFEEVPERRKQPKRIQTLPSAETEAATEREGEEPMPVPEEMAGISAGRPLYVEPEHCRCECHARRDDELPLLPADDAPDDAPDHRNIGVANCYSNVPACSGNADPNLWNVSRAAPAPRCGCNALGRRGLL
ncbi:uncharacterized protein [Battus philenor]|uniref:uncharacterized protein n=1 Tax=Battus philenor TaxID=42288 RepID=UPI0035CF5D3F